ncbi:MAG: DUF4175 family protein, partial [Cyclobacteriaceae bacterium]
LGLGFVLRPAENLTIQPDSKELAGVSTIDSTKQRKDSVFMTSLMTRIRPPAYTGLVSSWTEDMNLVAPQDSEISWHVQFNGQPTAVWLKFGQDSISFNRKTDSWKLSMVPKHNMIYTLGYANSQNEVNTSDFYELRLLEDEPPSIEILGIAQFRRLEYQGGLELDFQVKVSDTYGLTDAYLVATITKGSGESVMFREQKIPFSKKISGKSLSTEVTLKPDLFEMEPGNELYFYATAFDNHGPVSQQSRTETYFFVLNDTANIEFSLEGSLGVDLMPDFFRSQLQIILDTEKLLRERGKLETKTFNSTSNELGYDQKQLRLKYGQFIGEEEDSGLEVEQELPEESGEIPGENVLQEFGHDHDHENEEGQFMDRGTHDHHESSSDSGEEDPLEEFIHNHEDEETATFYTQTLKAKLREALNQMWDAELYLRLYQPEKSLPYQYEAQRLLKEIRNHARVYVQRIGFDPPPVNEEESRLTGKLKETNTDIFRFDTNSKEQYPAIQLAIGSI